MKNNEPRKKILLVTRPIGPPWDEASKNFAFALSKNIREFEITLLTAKTIENLPSNVMQASIYSSAQFNFSQKIKLINYLRQNVSNYDILHFLFTPTKINSWIIKKILKNKKVKTIQTIATLREDLYSNQDINKILFTDQIVTYSLYAKEKIESLGFNNVTQIYPGINLDQYSPAPKNLALMSQLGLKDDDFIVTFPGEFTRLGVIDELVKMVVKNSDEIRMKKIKMIFACRVKNKNDFIKKEKIKEELNEMNISDLVILPDTFRSMEKVFQASDIVLFSVNDMKGKFDVPLTVIEAMACGKPVIVSDLAILNEFANERNSVRIKTGDMDAVWKAVIDLFDSKELRKQIGETARNYVVNSFDVLKIADSYEKIYRDSIYGK
jgi:glycosyltransferase involved in cell wall biosynthesis